MSSTSLTIGKFAANAGVSVETVRFYQRQGLLPIPDTGAAIRRYGAEDIRKLRFIRKAQEAGFRLNEIKALIQLDASQDHEQAYQMAMSRLEALEQQIKDLQRARDSLKRLATECAGGTKTTHCAILAAFD